MKPNERDLEKVDKLITRGLSASLMLNEDIQWWMRRWLPETLAAERASLPKSVQESLFATVVAFANVRGGDPSIKEFVSVLNNTLAELKAWQAGE